MLLLLLLPILVAGYIILSYHPKHQYRLHRFDGQLLYLCSAYQGLICTIVGAFIVFALNAYAPSSFCVFGLTIPLDIHAWMASIFSPLEKKDGLIWMMLVSLASIGFAYIRVVRFNLWSLVKYKLRKEGSITGLPHKTLSKMYLMGEVLKDSPLDSLLYESFVSRHPEIFLMLSMDDSKVYVGKVISMGEPNEAEGLDQEIAIVPFLSGYRKKPTFKVEFTTKYKELDEGDAIQIVLRQERIVSATVFETSIYEAFQQQGPAEPNRQDIARDRLRENLQKPSIHI